LRKPRAGPSAVITSSVSPTSASGMRWSLRGSMNGMVMLERPAPTMLRAIVTGLVGSTTTSPIVITQPLPSG
jgi:hypothetical protein